MLGRSSLHRTRHIRPAQGDLMPSTIQLFCENAVLARGHAQSTRDKTYEIVADAHLRKSNLFCEKRLHSVGINVVTVELDALPVLDNLLEALSGAHREQLSDPMHVEIDKQLSCGSWAGDATAHITGRNDVYQLSHQARCQSHRGRCEDRRRSCWCLRNSKTLQQAASKPCNGAIGPCAHGLGLHVYVSPSPPVPIGTVAPHAQLMCSSNLRKPMYVCNISPLVMHV